MVNSSEAFRVPGLLTVQSGIEGDTEPAIQCLQCMGLISLLPQLTEAQLPKESHLDVFFSTLLANFVTSYECSALK